MLLRAARLVLPTTVVTDGWVIVDGEKITAVGGSDQPPPSDPDHDRETVDVDGWLHPGLVDLHVHGAAGASFDDGPAAIATALAAHRRCGTTRSVLSLITDDQPSMINTITAAAGYAGQDPHVLGLHLEGPFLSPERAGAHRPAALRPPAPAELDALIAAGDGAVKVITIAPELPGGIAAIGRIVEQGIVAAVGHTAADYSTALQAFDAGARLVTHAFNAMAPLLHRAPGVIGAAAERSDVVLEAIADGVHVHPSVLRLLASGFADRVALITDAMAAAAFGDGRYVLGGSDVDVAGGVARLVGADGALGSIAGSTLTLDAAIRTMITSGGLSVPAAVAAASLVPSVVLGVQDRFGSIESGKVADLVITDGDDRGPGQVLAVLAAGSWADERRPAGVTR